MEDGLKDFIVQLRKELDSVNRPSHAAVMAGAIAAMTPGPFIPGVGIVIGAATATAFVSSWLKNKRSVKKKVQSNNPLSPPVKSVSSSASPITAGTSPVEPIIEALPPSVYEPQKPTMKRIGDKTPSTKSVEQLVNEIRDLPTSIRDRTKFGAEVLKLTAEKGISLTNLAKEIGVSQSFIYKVVNAETFLKRETAVNITAFLSDNDEHARRMLSSLGFCFDETDKRDVVIIRCMQNSIPKNRYDDVLVALDLPPLYKQAEAH